MKKIFTKSLSVFLAALMFLMVAPLSLAADSAEQEEIANPTITVEIVSETPTELVVAVRLTENYFKCLDFTLAPNENLSLKKIVTDITLANSSNTNNGMISVARTELCEAPFEIAVYTFDKLTPAGVTSAALDAEITGCGIEGNIDVTDTAVLVVNIPDVHSHVADGDWEQTVEPKCDAAGAEVRYCKSCGEIAETREVPKTGHVNTTEDHKDATCTEAGYDKVICDDCGETLSSDEIPATNHKNTTTDHKDATCTEAGYDKVICDDCGETLSSDEIPATNHKNTTTDHKDATCTQAGYDKVICDDCGETISSTEIPETGHGETTLDRKAPTCTEEGYIKQICSVCNETVSEEIIPENGHNYINDIKLPTCTEDGYTRDICPACSDTRFEIPLPNTGHSWLDWETVKEPSHSKEGIERRICDNCGIDEERPIPKLVTKPTEIILSMQEITMNFRQTSRLFVNVLPEEAAYSTEIIWESSNPDVATVDETGAVYAVDLGTATITAKTADGSLVATCEVTVKYSVLQWIIIYILFGWIWYL